LLHSASVCILGDTLLFVIIFSPLGSSFCVCSRVGVVFLRYCAAEAG
jgi:hypothetical protein